jgi:cell division protein FtsB
VRLVIVVLVLLTMYLQYGLWYTRGGKQDVEKLKTSVAEQKDEIARLKERNRSLSAEVMDLKQGLEAIEERARSEMGMIKNGEVFFRITDPNHESDRPHSGAGVAKGGEPPLEPPLDPLTPGDGPIVDAPDSPPIAADKPVSVKPMVKALAKAAAATKATGAKPATATTAKPGVVKPAAKAAAAAAPNKNSVTTKAGSAVSAKTTASKAGAAKAAPKPATAAPPKTQPVSPSATSKTVTPSTTPRPATKVAPSTAPPARKPAVIE